LGLAVEERNNPCRTILKNVRAEFQAGTI